MNGNLIPEKRADKRGNLVTRWVRGFGRSGSSTDSIPSPSMSKSSRAFSTEQQSALIKRFIFGRKDDAPTAANIRYIAEHAPDVLNRVSAILENDDDIDLAFWASKINGGGQWLEHAPDADSKIKDMRESLVVFPLMRQVASGGGMDIEANEPYDVIYTVHETMKTSKIKNPSEETIAAVAAVVYATRAYVWRGEVTTPEYKDIRKDVDYVRDHVEDIVRILPELHKRKTMDRGVIETLLNSPTQALNEGEL